MSFIAPGLLGAIAGGGVTSPPGPGNRLLWWSADGTGGTTWQDEACTIPAAISSRVAAIKTAEGLVFSQSDAPQRPLLQGSVQNGLNGLFFSQPRNDYLGTTDAAFLALLQAKPALTVLMVWKYQNGSGDHNGLQFRPQGSSGGLMLRRNPSTKTQAGRYGTGNTLAEYTSASAITVSHSVVLSSDGIGGSLKKNRVYVQAAANTANATTDATDGIAWTDGTIGANRANPGHNAFLTGYIFELAIFDAAFDATAVGALFSYATAKWGLP